MKKLLLISAVFLTAIAAMECSIEKTIQVKPILLTLVYIKESNRDDKGALYWLKWIDEHRDEYSMYCYCPQYRLGDKQTFLITR